MPGRLFSSLQELPHRQRGNAVGFGISIELILAQLNRS
jgi:hypothetical protein